jgi:type I restriction enzyme S subunit
VVPLLEVAHQREEPNAGMLEENLLSLSYGRIVQKDISANDGLLPASFETYQIVRPGDVVFRLTDLQNDRRSLRTAIVEQRGIITSAYIAVTPTGILPRYFNYLLRTYDVRKVFYSMGGGLRQSMKFSDLRKLPILLPTDAEQSAIVTFLDRETAKIDTLVDEQKRLMELLKEKRQAVISHSVTKGLNPNVPMKDSGVKWLGQVPAHWEVMKLKRMVSHVVDCLHTTPTYEGETKYPAVRTADLERGVLLLDQAKLVCREVYEERIQRLEPRGGDILYSREGERFGMAALVPEGVNLCLGQRMMMFRAAVPNSPGYVMWALNSDAVYNQVLAGTAGSTSPHINIADVINYYIPCPGPAEQAEISDYLFTEIASLDALVAEAQSAAQLLQERRAALISAAVTGKIDVRGATIAAEAA